MSTRDFELGMIHFIVMDHDFLRANDFAGEAFLQLNDVPGYGPNAGTALKQFNLILIHPQNKGAPAFSLPVGFIFIQFYHVKSNCVYFAISTNTEILI